MTMFFRAVLVAAVLAANIDQSQALTTNNIIKSLIGKAPSIERGLKQLVTSDQSHSAELKSQSNFRFIIISSQNSFSFILNYQ
jgi:hypothetical protein